LQNKINKNFFIYYLLNKENNFSISSTNYILPIPLIRYFSTVRNSFINIKPESLALEHINSGVKTTSSIINKILLNQNLSVTDAKLENLLKVKGVEINIPISNAKDMKILEELTGKSKYKGFFGVYIFIHKFTNQKYVGSSNLLRRRMDYYFNKKYLSTSGETKPLSRFLNLLHKEGLAAFKLIIYKLDENKFSIKDALILEQYYLLNKEFNLNTLKVVNVGSSKGEGVYIYNLNCNALLYHAKSRIELKRVLKIHPDTCKIYIDSKIPYLNKFILLSFPVSTASISNISIKELVDLMQKERLNSYKLGSRRSVPVELEIKKGNTFIASWYQTLKFDSLTSCIEYLRGLGLTIKRDTLTKYIKIEKVFHNFLCKYSEKDLPNNFEEIGLIINEYKKFKEDRNLDSLIIKKKPILVKGDKFEKEFESITNTINYFNSLNIKLDRKTLNLHLKNGKLYKNYFFSYKYK
jgi:GIY-YIG catalytic domain-containing protein